MNRISLGVAALLASSAAVSAGGLDRSGQPIDILFEDGRVAQFSFGFSSPSVNGTEVTGAATGSVADSFSTFGAGVKFDISKKLSFAFILDEPFGSDVTYPGSGATSLLGGTRAIVDSNAYTALLRYKFNDNFSIHGGPRYQTTSANLTLSGQALGALNGYNASFSNDGALGYVAGASFEKPEIALRVSLTYNSQIDHDFDTVETNVPLLGTLNSTTQISTPESWNLDFQTGVAANTLLFGSLRYGKNSDTQVSPQGFDAVVNPGVAGDSVSDIEDSLDYEIGLARRFNDKWSGSIAIGLSTSDGDNLVSPLSPSDGFRYVSVGAQYELSDQVSLRGGIRYPDLGDAIGAVGAADTPVANFNGNSAVSAGFQVSYRF